MTIRNGLMPGINQPPDRGGIGRAWQAPLDGAGLLSPLEDSSELPSFAGLFEQCSRRWADLVAVDDGIVKMTYLELERETSLVARALQAMSGPLDSPIAVLTDVAAAAVIAFVSVVRSGHPIVILDRAVPVARMQLILRLSGATHLVTDDASRELAYEVANHTMPTQTLAGLRSTPGLPTELRPVDPGALAAIIFTSGSSGQPKGVMWSQRLLAAEPFCTGQTLGYGPGEELALLLPISFAWGLSMTVVGLSRGACLHVADPRRLDMGKLVDWIRQKKVTVLPMTPSMLRNLCRAIEPGETFPRLRLLCTAGEALNPADVVAARAILPPDAVVVNVFGSSEGGCLTTLHMNATDPIPEASIPAGIATPWRTMRIIDEAGEEVRAGTAGDLVITAPVMADGYWRDPERSAGRFRKRADGLWDLRTGDVGTLDEDGTLRLLGRSEAAVKIRGYLVDPSEIEAAMLASGHAREVVVIAATEDDTTRLIAYFVPTKGSSGASVAALRGSLATRLPIWMVPAHLVAMRELPRNERGKVDRQALPAVPARQVDPPQGPFETQVATIWCQLLNVDEVGRYDDFIELGGDSLAAEEMLAEVEQQIGVTVLTSDFIQATRLCDFVDRIVGAVKPAEPTAWPETVVKMRTGTSGRTVFCVAGGGASALTFVPLSARLAPGDAVVTLQGRGVARRAPAEWTFGGMVRRRIAKVRRIQPTGPYLLLGHSFGAIIVLEMARRMSARGEDVTVFLIDPFLSETGAARNERAQSTDSLLDEQIPGPRLLARRLNQLVRQPKLLAAGLLPARLERRFGLTFEQSMLLARSHSPGMWTGKVYAYRSAENTDPPGLWKRILPNAKVRDIVGSHMSILQTPYVEVIIADIECEQATP